MRARTTSIVVPLVLIALGGCTQQEQIKSPFKDAFDRAAPGDDYNNTGGPYAIGGGKLKIKGAYNHPLWLRKILPRDAVIELDVTSRTPDGDIKVEAWGDGQSYATTRGGYLATSYVFIFGGWGNSKSVLARMDEHAPDIKLRTEPRVETNRTYRFKIQRKGKKVEWFIDGKPFLALEDPQPLDGTNHAYFGFNNWESELEFDNLVIKPL